MWCVSAFLQRGPSEPRRGRIGGRRSSVQGGALRSSALYRLYSVTRYQAHTQAVIADWAAGISCPVLVYVKAAVDYIPFHRRHELDDSAAGFHLGAPAGSLDLYDWGRAELTSDTTVIFVWLGSGPNQHKRDAHFVLRYEYKFADREWSKTLKVFPRIEQDPIWSRWDEWEMARNGWEQLDRIEARKEIQYDVAVVGIAA